MNKPFIYMPAEKNYWSVGRGGHRSMSTPKYVTSCSGRCR